MSYTETYTYANRGMHWAKVAFFTAAACLCIAGAVVLFCLVPFIQHEDARLSDTHATADATIRGTRTDLAGEMKKTRLLVDRRTGEALEEVRAMRITTDQRTGEALARVESLQAMVDQRTGEALAEVRATRMDSTATLNRVTIPLEKTITDFHEQFMNCTGAAGAGCLQSRWLAMSGESMRTMDQVRLTSIEFTGISKDVHRAADRYTKEPGPWKRLYNNTLGLALDLARLSYLLHGPPTN